MPHHIRVCIDRTLIYKRLYEGNARLTSTRDSQGLIFHGVDAGCSHCRDSLWSWVQNWPFPSRLHHRISVLQSRTLSLRNSHLVHFHRFFCFFFLAKYCTRASLFPHYISLRLFLLFSVFEFLLSKLRAWPSTVCLEVDTLGVWSPPL